MSERALVRGLAVLVLGAVALPAQAREVRATFLSVEDGGERRQRAMQDVRYGYFVRTFLSKRVPKSQQAAGAPVPHRDRTYRKRNLILQNDKIPLHMLQSIRFSYRPSDTPGTEELVLRVELDTGLERDVPASELRGYGSFAPPFLEGTEDGVPRRFALPPFRAAGSAGGEMILEKVVFDPVVRRTTRRR
jgi:hypothetical protein